jgi:spore maturation protein CgeB
MLYIQENENTKRIKFVTVLTPWEQVSKELTQKIKFLDNEYEEITVDFRVLHWEFTPELIHKLSHERKIPVNFMFIGSPSKKFPYSIEELWWVRLII